MASSWGDSWGTSWGHSWGALSPVWYGGDDAPGWNWQKPRKRKERRDVFKDIERTIHELLHLSIEAKHIENVKPVIQTVLLERKLQDLLNLAGESQGLLQRTNRLQAKFEAIQRDTQAQRESNDEEDFIMWLT